MNGNRIVNMVLRMAMRKLFSRGATAGMDRMLGRNRRAEGAAARGTGRAPESTRRARRMGRF